MASTFVSSIGKLEEGAMGGIRRSRFSFHLRTPGARRWLLVQLVSVPMKAEPILNAKANYHTERADDPADTYSRLIDDYRNQQFVRRGF